MDTAPQYTFLICPNPEARDLYADNAEPGGGRGDSGIDLRFAEDVTIPPMAHTDGMPVLIGLMVRVRGVTASGAYFPYEIRPRSSIAKSPLSLANSVGTIDVGYMGELRLAIRNHASEPYTVKRGTSLFQLTRADLAPAAVTVVDASCPHLAATARGTGGFGSTGAAGTGLPTDN